MQLFDLRGKTAIVTGSSRGIGKAIAHRLAEHGADVVVSSRKLDACKAAASEINAAIGRSAAIPIAANIAAKPALEDLVRETERNFGKIDIVVCNAATNPYYGPISGIGDEQFTKILQNNIISNHWLVQLTAPQMCARKDGAIVIISSVGGLVALPNLGAYNISKAADMALVRNLALELGPDNVRVNAIAPGLVQTDFAKALWDDPENRKTFVDNSCLGRVGQPDDIAGVAVFLASPAGAFATGQTFVIDGGQTTV